MRAGLSLRAPVGVDLSGWRGHLIALGIVSAAILLTFAGDVVDMVEIWWNASTFAHCLFIPPIIGWLVHQRLDGLRQLTPVAWAPGLVWLGLGAFAWMLGEAAGVAMVRQGAVVVMVQGAVVALLGPAVARALAFPLFYAFFMVPFGEEVVPALQLLTAKLAMVFLALAGVPAHLEGIFITTPTGYFEVAEACSGAKFLIAMTAYGVLVCHVCFRSWGRRFAFMGGALALSVLANGVRAFATILVAHWTTVDAAVGFDHVVYGWVFFAIVMTVTMAVAWPFLTVGRVIRCSIRAPCKGRCAVTGRCRWCWALGWCWPLPRRCGLHGRRRRASHCPRTWQRRALRDGRRRASPWPIPGGRVSTGQIIWRPCDTATAPGRWWTSPSPLISRRPKGANWWALRKGRLIPRANGYGLHPRPHPPMRAGSRSPRPARWCVMS